VALNKRAFTWGRIAAANPQALAQVTEDEAGQMPAMPDTLDGLIEHYQRELTAYQNAKYAKRFVGLVEAARTAEKAVSPQSEAFASAVATSAYRLMAYKDEYEVARLYAGEDFASSLSRQFSRTEKISVWLAPPMLSRKLDPATGRPKKIRFGPWVLSAFKVLAGLRGLRGTPLDVFGHTHERRRERALIAEYFADTELLCSTLTAASHGKAVSLASLPQEIRGFGPVKEQAMDDYAKRKRELQADDFQPVQIHRRKVA